MTLHFTQVFLSLGSSAKGIGQRGRYKQVFSLFYSIFLFCSYWLTLLTLGWTN
jgi:uncharacterized membrane protein